ncbi:MAG: helix-turn-helix domain-containing protein [Candidatus Omnitrophica bacterium]|nr:helix-turn-helix domain-containing protein [Candidatus Omnitrophota bacterium]
MPGFKVGATWRFKKSSIDKWIDEQERNITKNSAN